MSQSPEATAALLSTLPMDLRQQCAQLLIACANSQRELPPELRERWKAYGEKFQMLGHELCDQIDEMDARATERNGRPESADDTRTWIEAATPAAQRSKFLVAEMRALLRDTLEFVSPSSAAKPLAP